MMYRIKNCITKVISYIKSLGKKKLIILSFCIVLFAGVLYLFLLYITEKNVEVKDVRITNVTGTSATITWITDTPAKGTVIYSENNKWFPIINNIGKKRAYDDRDIEEVEYNKYELKQEGKYYVHHVTIRNLEPNKRYYFLISTGLKTTEYDYPSLETVEIVEELVDPFPVYGRVLSMSGDISEEVIVYLWLVSQKGKSQLLSTITSTSSGWSIDMGNILGEELDGMYDKDMAKVYIEANSGWDKKELWEVNLDMVQPVDDILLTNNITEKTARLRESLVEGVYASSCNNRDDFINSCMSGSRNTDGTARTREDCEALDYEGWKRENCVSETSTTTTIPVEEGQTAGGVKYEGDGWCGKGDYCINDVLYNCESDKACKLDDPCQYGCKVNQRCTNDRCFTSSEKAGTEQPVPSDYIDGCPYEVYKPSGGEKCESGVLVGENGDPIYPQLWCAASCSSEQKTVEQNSKCCNNENLCSCGEKGTQIAEIGDTFGNPKEGHKYECKDGVLYDTTEAIASSFQSWCGEYIDNSQSQSTCPFTIMLNYSGCNNKPLCGCAKEEEVIKQENEIAETDLKCSIGEDGWNNVKNYQDLISSNLPDGLGLYGRRSVEKNDIHYIISCDKGTVISSFEIGHHWNVTILEVGGNKTCDELGLSGYPTGTILEKEDSLFVCDEGQAIQIEDYGHELRAGCKGTIHDGLGEYIDYKTQINHYLNCSMDALKAGSYHSYTPFVTLSNGCIPTRGLPDCREECTTKFGTCAGKHREACEVKDYYNNCMYGFDCKKIDEFYICIDGDSDEDGDGILYYNDEDPLDPCTPYREDQSDCPSDEKVSIAPVGGEVDKYSDITIGDVGEQRTGGLAAVVISTYDQQLLDDCEYDGLSNTTNCKSQVLIHQFGNDYPAENYEAYLLSNVRSAEGDIVGVHYIITKDGTIIQLGPNNYVFPQAGDPELNLSTIGIEFEGESGQQMTKAQIDAGSQLMKDLETTNVIPNRCNLVGHNEVGLTGPGGVYNNPDPGEENMERLRENLECDGQQSFKFKPLTRHLINKVNAEINEKSEVEVLGGVLKKGQNSTVFWDMNRNGKIDPLEKSVSVSELKDMNLKNALIIELKLGWNSVDIPLYTDVENGTKVTTAKELLEEINQQGLYVTHIATYRGGRWIIYSKRGDISFSNDFSILPGEGYFIRVHKEGQILLRGSKFEESVPLDLEIGWNLVGIISPGKEYTAGSLIDGIVNSNIGADTITKWDSGMYENYIKEGGLSYGQDYRIFEIGGYFIRVKEKGGNFKP